MRSVNTVRCGGGGLSGVAMFQERKGGCEQAGQQEDGGSDGSWPRAWIRLDAD